MNMSRERELLGVALDFLDPRRWLDPADQHILNILSRDIEELLAQPEQTEYIKKKKEPEIYFVKDEFGTLRPTFKNPKETPFWIDVLHRGGGVRR
jgi:hypothetical protein